MAEEYYDTMGASLDGNEPSFTPGPQYSVPAKDAEAIVDRCNKMYLDMVDDRETLDHYAEYARGNQSDPYLPNYADPAAKELAGRSTLNLMTLAINVPAQISYIDGYSRKGSFDPPEWDTWVKSNMATKQTRLFISSLTYGQGYTMLSNIGTDDLRVDLLSARDTIAYFEDAANDTSPVWGLTIKSKPSHHGETPGLAVYMDAERVVYLDYDGSDFTVRPDGAMDHGLGITPMVRWPAILDDRGYARGVVEDLIPAQDRVNQTVFDGLLNQSFGSYGVRWAAGLVGEPVFNEDGTPRLDADDNQVYKPIPVSQSRMLTTDDPNAKFGTLEGTEQKGFLEALDSAIKSFAVTGQLPPHSLLGQMSNLSAETLQALMAQTTRFTQMLRGAWADSAIQQLRLISRARNIPDGVKAEEAEVRWRDMETQTMAATVDALGKASQMLGVPGRGLWKRIPGVTASEINFWEELQAEEETQIAAGDIEDTDAAIARETAGASGGEDAGAEKPSEAAGVRDTLRGRVGTA